MGGWVVLWKACKLQQNNNNEGGAGYLDRCVLFARCFSSLWNYVQLLLLLSGAEWKLAVYMLLPCSRVGMVSKLGNSE